MIMQTCGNQTAKGPLGPGTATAILTKRLLHSPIYKNIWEFHSEDKDREYLVFVGEVSIHLKEISKDGRLRDVAVKDNFGGKILSSKVLGQRAFHLNEDDKSGNDSFFVSSPRILLLCLEHGQLLMLTGLDDASGNFSKTWSVPLPFRSSPLSDPGRFIAVDPYSRAIAVAAFEDTIVLHNLKSRPDSPMSSPESFRDILTIDVKAVICALDFLYSPGGHDDTINLIVVGTRQGRFRLIVCSWNYYLPLEQDKVQIHTHRLGKEHGMPSLLAPLKHAGSFLFVCEQVIAIYQYGHDGSIQQVYCVSHRYDDLELLSFPTWPGSRRPPLWTAWARSLQNIDGVVDTLYIARASGRLHCLTFGKVQGNVRIIGTGLVGTFELDIDNAFAVPAISVDGNDMVVVGGDRGNVGLFQITDLDVPRCHDLSTLSSIQLRIGKLEILHRMDNQVAGAQLTVGNSPSPYPPQHKSTMEMAHMGSSATSRRKLWATSGIYSTSCVSEINYGLNMRIVKGHKPADVSGIDCLWFLSDFEDTALFLCSFPWQSTLLSIDGSTSINCDIAHEPTLAICILPSYSFVDTLENTTIIIQVTPSSIQFLEVHQEKTSSIAVQQLASFNEGRITAATILPDRKIVVLVKEDSNTYSICTRRILYHNGRYSLSDTVKTLCTESEPTSLIEMKYLQAPNDSMSMETDHEHHDEHLYCVVGEASGAIGIVRFDDPNSSQPVVKICDPSADPFNACVSLLTLPLQVPILLCGFRDGTLLVVELDKDHAKLQWKWHVKTKSVFRIGQLPVKVIADPCRSTAAFLSCESNLHHVDLGGKRTKTPSMCQVFIPELSRARGKDFLIDAVCCISKGSFADHLMCVADGKTYVGSIMPQPPQLFSTPHSQMHTPRRLMHSSHLNSIVVIGTNTEVNWETNQRCQTSILELLDSLGTLDFEFPDGQTLPDVRLVTSSYYCAIGETVNNVTEWFYTRDRHTYHFLILTILRRHPGGQETGGLKYLKVSTNRHGEWSVRMAHESRESEPVYAVCRLGNDALVYGCGLDLKVRVFNADKDRFGTPISHRLGSPAIFLTANEPLIHVTTAEHGFMIFKFEEGKFILVLSEDRARPGICHMYESSQNSFLVPDRMGHVAIISVPDASKTQDNAIRSWKSVKVPCSITSLVKADIRPPWKNQPPGVVADGIFGSSTDGSLFHFSFLHEPAWILLNLLQLLCQSHPDLRGAASQSWTIRTFTMADLETDDHQVDGDILARLLGQSDVVQIIEGMLSAPADAMVLNQAVEVVLPKQRVYICKTQLERMGLRSASSGDVEEMNGDLIEDSVDVEELVRDIITFLELVLDIPM